MNPKLLVVHEEGTAAMPGLQHPNAKVLARDEGTIAIKVPARTYASGIRGMGRSYAPAETLVFSIKGSRGVGGIPFSGFGEVLEVQVLLRWTHEKLPKT